MIATARSTIFRAAAAALALALVAASPAASQQVLYRSPAFMVTDSSVVQGPFTAVAASRDTIYSTYPRAGREAQYKFAIGGEFEFPPGTEYTLYVRPRQGRIVTPVYEYGVPVAPGPVTPESEASSEEGPARVTFRADLRPVLRASRDSGAYRSWTGAAIRAADLARGVYVVGNLEPLTWNADSLRPGSPFQLTDADGDSVYTATVTFQAAYTRPLAPDGRAMWARTLDVSSFPRLTSPQVLVDALYRMSLEELRQLMRSDGALSAGAKWPGVWTRDVSLSTVLALALVVPDAVRTSLLAKVDSTGRIIQDTGTGGSWPVSTDRETWALAAWELYAATGDRDWLRRAHDIVQRSVEADLHAARDASTGLFHGESSFLDWREQSYPTWMDPKDIYQGEALGTNAVHYGAYRVLAAMSRALGRPSARWDAVADGIRGGMNAYFWQPTLGWYGQYRYGRDYPSLSPRAEALGEALSAVYGVPDTEQRAALASHSPVVAFGKPTFWPYIPAMRAYHNATIWPFVNAYWTWEAAELGNTAAVEHGLASTFRAAGLFLTNKENMVAATGHFDGTALNSDRQLWSVAGTLAAAYRVLFGIRLGENGLTFRPMVPPGYAGERRLDGLRYRGATLTVIERGYGSGVASARLDGRLLPRAEVPATLTGAHTVELELDGRWPTTNEHLVANRFAPETPRAVLRGDTLAWEAIPGATGYVVYRDGRPESRTADRAFVVRREPTLSEYQVLAVDSTGLESFLGEPVRVVADAGVVVAEPAVATEQAHRGFTGAGYATLALDHDTVVTVTIRVPAAGLYALDVRYANGAGPVNTDSKAAIRTLDVDGRPAGVLVMPQRGDGLWEDWGYSNALRVRLSAGAHRLVIRYTPLDANMDRLHNTALLDHVRLTRLRAVPAARRAAPRGPRRGTGAGTRAPATGRPRPQGTSRSSGAGDRAASSRSTPAAVYAIQGVPPGAPERP